jgi:hypothetical protein
MKLKLMAALILTALLSPSLFAGWSQMQRLTYRGNEADPQVVARNDTVHVAWRQGGGVESKISYIRSADNGDSWGTIIDLTESGHSGSFPNLVKTDERIWVGWKDDNGAIALRSSQNGSAWNPPIYKYTIDSQRFTFLCIDASGDTLFVAYKTSLTDSTGLEPYRFLRSPDGGLTWSNLINIGHVPNNAAVSKEVISYCNGNLMLATDHNIDSLGGGVHITGYMSYDNGDHWSEPTLISPLQQAWSLLPSLSCNQNTFQMAIGYKDYRYQQYPFYGDIFIKSSTSDTTQWGEELQITNNHTAKQPSISFLGNSLVCVWMDRTYFSTGNDEIFFNSSNDGGVTWNGIQRLTNTPAMSTYPWVYNTNDMIHIVWYEDDTVGINSCDIYYMKYTPDSSDIINIDTPIPSSFQISAYPNPFNSTLSISIKAEEMGSIYITDILGRFVTKLKYSKGVSNLKWGAIDKDGKALPSGAYFIKNKGGSYNDMLKVMYLK